MAINQRLKQSVPNQRGVTLIELLVVLVISGIVVGGAYKLFILQTRAYTSQDQVAEMQQDVRGAMEIMLRDIRMAGYQTNSFAATPANANASNLISTNRIVTPLNDNSITVYYEYNPTSSCPQVYQVNYGLSGTTLNRTLSVFDCNNNPVSAATAADLLDNVKSLTFSYGIDANGDGIMDNIDTSTGLTPVTAFQNAAAVNGQPTATILAVRIQLTANPGSVDPDVNKIVSPRTLTSVVIPRNIFFKRFQAY